MNTSSSFYDDDRNLDEVFRMYGIKAALDNSNNVDDDCQSEGSDDLLAERLNSKLFVVRASASSGKILAQYSMDEATDTIADHLVDRNRRMRIPCLVFRSMLQPMQKDKVPVRDEEWLRKCMRGFSLQQKFGPQQVYCWFVEHGGDIDAWSYYYGKQKLVSANTNAEAWIHYQLLDDVNLDFSEFLLDALSLVRSLKTQSRDNLLGIDSSGCNIWIPPELTKQVIENIFGAVWSKFSIEELNRDILETLSEASDEVDRVELFSFLQHLLNAHMGQMKKQTTLLRVMFETAATKDSHEVVSVDAEKLVTLTQLHEILKSLHEPITLTETSLLYRDAYELLIEKAPHGRVPRGITFDSFLFEAKRRGLFSHIRREQRAAAIAIQAEQLSI